MAVVRRGASVRPSYTVETLESSAVTVREYVSPAGVVFAVAWEGLAQPDLDTLLGASAAEYRRARANTPPVPGRRSHRVATDHVVVETWGHMRHLQGRAYVPALVPDGVSVDELR